MRLWHIQSKKRQKQGRKSYKKKNVQQSTKKSEGWRKCHLRFCVEEIYHQRVQQAIAWLQFRTRKIKRYSGVEVTENRWAIVDNIKINMNTVSSVKIWTCFTFIFVSIKTVDGQISERISESNWYFVVVGHLCVTALNKLNGLSVWIFIGRDRKSSFKSLLELDSKFIRGHNSYDKGIIRHIKKNLEVSTNTRPLDCCQCLLND